MTRTRVPIENPELRTKRPKVERGEQSRVDTGKGRRREEAGEEESIFVIGSDDVQSSDNDVLLSEELQIQEILFTTMQSEKKPEQGSKISKLDPTDRKGKRPTETTYFKPEHKKKSSFTHAKSPYSKPEPGQSSSITRAKTPYSKPEHGHRPSLTRAKTPYSKHVYGQSSSLSRAKTPCPKPEPSQNSRPNHAKTLCKICMECVLTNHFFTINPCNHLFCNSCMVRYITSQLDQNIADIPCPNPGCKSRSLDPLTCQDILPTSTFDKWGRALCESSLGLKKFYCPFKDCSALLVDEGCEEVRNCECPHCNRMFCAKCEVPWHGDMSCEEFQSLGKDERAQEDLMLRKLARDKRWQRCPQCRMYVEKTDGCMFMQCRCAYCFCYVCATPMSKETHYCTKCKR